MKLQDIRERLADLAQMRIGETIEEYSQRAWDGLPRMPFKELPLSLQREVRKRHTPETIRQFLIDLYSTPDFEAQVKSLSPAERQQLPSPPEEYVSFDTMTADIQTEDLDKILTRTRNTATYTIEYEAAGQLAPMLYGNYARAAFEAAVHDYKERQQRDPAPQPTTATRAGSIVSAGYYQYIISDPHYQNALTTQRNKNAYIALMNPDFFNRLDFSHEASVLTYNQETAGIVRQYSRGKYEDIKDLDFPLLTQIYTAAAKAQIRHDAYTITVSMPEFFRGMGIDPSKGNAPDIMAKLHSFENCVGIMPGTGTVSKLFSIIEMDMKDQTMTFAVPYIIRLYEVLEDKHHIERTTKKGEAVDYVTPFHNSLVHSTIANERNKTAVELVYLITTGLLQRGYVPDIETYRKKGAKTAFPDRITYSITYRSLINNSLLLRGRINSYKTAQNKNIALRRAFEKAYQLIDTKTDAAEWFINLHIDNVIPTMTTLDNELTITH